MFGFISSLFSCNSKPEYPFDTQKAYCYHRQGVIAGGNCLIELSDTQIVQYYSYPVPVPENECGMKDRGADIYFVGLTPGKVEVTLTYTYPTCESESETLVLTVAQDLSVTKP
ncbi:MAG: hypothetical protein IJE16_06530 [Ruminococcus sp.]|nr:hypothetical protein [Ruminococcus sp.]